jgi:hypothetical protein
MTDSPNPADPNVPPIQTAIADLVVTYGISGILRGLRDYTQSKAAMFRAVESDRAHAWTGLAHLLQQALDVAMRMESDEERGR